MGLLSEQRVNVLLIPIRYEYCCCRSDLFGYKCDFAAETVPKKAAHWVWWVGFIASRVHVNHST